MMPVVIFSVLMIVVLFAVVVLCAKKGPRESAPKTVQHGNTKRHNLQTSVNTPSFNVSNPPSQQAHAARAPTHTSAISEKRLVDITRIHPKMQTFNSFSTSSLTCSFTLHGGCA